MDVDVKKIASEVQTPWGEIGYIVMKRTYARRLDNSDPDSPTEEFWQIVERELKALSSQLNLHLSPDEQERYVRYRLGLKFSVAGRFMWQLGTATVDRLGLPSLQNCSFVVVNDPVRPFTWAFDMLMLGSGVGFNIQKEHVYQLPRLKYGKIRIERKDTNDADFIVPDSREGWVQLLGKVLKAHFYGGRGFTYSTVCIRSKGAPIRSFGGVASGPEDLCSGIEAVNNILNSRAGMKLRPIDCLDIMNIIGRIVVSGNVRRSAQIAIGDYDDIEFLRAKRWDLGNIPNWRAMSNNSVYAPVHDMSLLPKAYWETFEHGEPYGLVNLELSRSCGRTGETMYADPDVEGYNPCGEQSLANYETCCLSEVYLPNIGSYEELLDVLSLTYRVNKHSLTLPCHLKETEAVVHRHMRMGIGMTGILQATEEQRSWLDPAYRWLRAYDRDYSVAHGMPPSIKLTTVKPSGTLSLLAGVTPGAHPAPAGPYYYRRVRMSSGDPLAELCRSHGYHVEPVIEFDGSFNPNTVVVTFPCKLPEGVPVASQLTFEQQLEVVKWLQRVWSDNSVSCTVYYKKDQDIPAIKAYLEQHFRENFKTLSFLPYHNHGFMQAPYETIDKATYEAAVANIKPITSVSTYSDTTPFDDCSSGACPVR